MITRLRNKLEDYLDFKFDDYHGARRTDAEAAELSRRIKEFMRSLGWRTYTADELSRASSRKEAGEQMKQIANGIVSATKDVTGERLRSAGRPDASGAQRPTR